MSVATIASTLPVASGIASARARSSSPRPLEAHAFERQRRKVDADHAAHPAERARRRAGAATDVDDHRLGLSPRAGQPDP